MKITFLCFLHPSWSPNSHEEPSRGPRVTEQLRPEFNPFFFLLGVMADREGPPVSSDHVYIEVEYDYEYEAKDKMVTIRQGEWYMLVKKTNMDWWQVRKDEGAKAFYVPAQYVREVQHALLPPQKPSVKSKPTVLDICNHSDANLNRPKPEMSSFGYQSPPSILSPTFDRVIPPALPKDTNQNVGNPHQDKLVAELVLLQRNNNHYHTINASLPKTVADSPMLKVGDSPGSNKTSPVDELIHVGLKKLHNDSESGDELSSSSTEHLQVRCCFTD